MKKVIFTCYQYYCNYHHYCYHTTLFTVLRVNLNYIKRRHVHSHCQNSVSHELILALNWNFQRILKGEDHLTKTQYVHTTANATVTVTFTTTITTSIATTCRA
jgi:hypothetical protein